MSNFIIQQLHLKKKKKVLTLPLEPIHKVNDLSNHRSYPLPVINILPNSSNLFESS